MKTEDKKVSKEKLSIPVSVWLSYLLLLGCFTSILASVFFVFANPFEAHRVGEKEIWEYIIHLPMLHLEVTSSLGPSAMTLVLAVFFLFLWLIWVLIRKKNTRFNETVLYRKK